MKWHFQRKYINLFYLLGILLLILLNAVSYFQIRALNEANNWVIHTHHVIETAENILVEFNYSEIKIRSYLISGDKVYITSYQNAFSDLTKNLNSLQELTADNPSQQVEVQKIIYLFNERLASLRSSYSETRGDLQKAFKVIVSENSRILTDQIEQALNNIIQSENDLLSQRNITLTANANQMNLLVSFAYLFTLCLIIACFLLLNSQLNLRLHTERKLLESEEELTQLAYYDKLTGLANRTLLFRSIEKCIRFSETSDLNMAAILINIDHFKNINDSFGYEVGDELLKEFSYLLKKLSSTDAIVARTGGNDFVVFLPTIQNHDDIIKFVKFVLENVTKPMLVNNLRIFITLSIGISVFPNNGIDARTLIKNADIALFRAKELGQNNYQFCTPEMSIKVKERALLDYYLHQALEKKEFILLYQPKISLKENRPIGVEALMRWHESKAGLIYPEHFISLAENNGLIIPIGESMLRTACEQGKEWQKQGIPAFHIAVNVSPRQVSTTQFVDSVKKVLAETNFDPHCLELEITESILMDHSPHNIQALHDLQALGIKATIDDFGTAYSSLSYLKLFAIDKLKIDKSFLDEIVSVNSDTSIIKAIIAMAHNLGMQVVAEGVESFIQIELLKKYHCDEAQGYFYSKPLTAEEIPDFFNYFNSEN